MINAASCLITGASTGIGLASARMLVDAGVRVAATVRSKERMEELVQLGIIPVYMEASRPESVERAFVEAREILGGKIDYLILNHGYAALGAAADLPGSEIQQQFSVNFFSYQQIISLHIKSNTPYRPSKIILMSSVLGFMSAPMRGAYCASKHALEGFAGCLRAELRSINSSITVSMIQPGPIRAAFQLTALEVFRRSVKPHIQTTWWSEHYLQMEERLRSPATRRWPAEKVAKVVVQACQSRDPKPRYIVTPPSLVGAIMCRILPAKWIANVAARMAP